MTRKKNLCSFMQTKKFNQCSMRTPNVREPNTPENILSIWELTLWFCSEPSFCSGENFNGLGVHFHQVQSESTYLGFRIAVTSKEGTDWEVGWGRLLEGQRCISLLPVAATWLQEHVNIHQAMHERCVNHTFHMCGSSVKNRIRVFQYGICIWLLISTISAVFA